MSAKSMKAWRQNPANREREARLRIARRLRGPSGKRATDPAPNVHEGHELRGQSTLIDGSGNLSARWDKTGLAPTDEPAHPPIPEGHHVTSTSTMVDGTGATRVQWVRAEPQKAAREAAFWAAAEAHAKRTVAIPLPPIVPPASTREDMIAWYPMGDPHIGLLAWAPETGEHHDARIAERDLLYVVDMLVDAAPPAFEGVLVNLGDFLHAQSDEQRTPRAGHKLDVDGRRGKILELGLSLMQRLTIRLLEKHSRVTVVNIPGNHDPDVSIMLALWLQQAFKANERVTIEPAHSPFYYREWGQNSWQISHGDGAPPQRLHQQHAAHPSWGRTRFHYSYGGHVHSKNRIEYPAWRWESFNTLAAQDAWSNHEGYGAQRELTVIGCHREWGEIVRSTVDLGQARARMGAGT